MAISQPIKSRLYSYEHQSPIEIANNTFNAVDAYFYYDLARLYTHTLLNNLVRNEDMNNGGDSALTFPICGKYLTDRQMSERSSLQLYHQLIEQVHLGMFGQFMFSSNFNYQELSMAINRITFRNGTRHQIYKLAEWEFEGHLGHLYFTSPKERTKRSGIAHYTIVTLIVSFFRHFLTSNYNVY